MLRLITLVACMALFTACNFTFDETRSVPAVATAQVSTPVAQSLPTALPGDIVDAADAEVLLLTNIYERTSPSVVNIEASHLDSSGAVTDSRRGSGFVYDRAGHIITNAHLVRDADAIEVTLQNAYVLPADIIGLDSFSDLAVLKVDVASERLTPLLIGQSASAKVGQRAISIGNPFGLNSSMTAGIVSGLGRTLPSAEIMDVGVMPGFDNPSIIQFDANINPGNSGGPLLDSRGMVIGITTAIRSDNGLFQGVGFAVPADTMRRVIPDLIAQGSVDYSWMGISVMREDGGYGVAGLSAALDLPVDRGVLLRGVAEGSPAHAAGLRGGDRSVEVRGESVCAGGDLIIAVNDYHFANLDDLVTYLVQMTRPGEEVEMLVIRDGRTIEVTLTLEGRPTAAAGRTLDCSVQP